MAVEADAGVIVPVNEKPHDAGAPIVPVIDQLTVVPASVPEADPVMAVPPQLAAYVTEPVVELVGVTV